MKKLDIKEKEETGRKGIRRNRKERNMRKQDENERKEEQYNKRRKRKTLEGKYKDKERDWRMKTLNGMLWIKEIRKRRSSSL